MDWTGKYVRIIKEDLNSTSSKIGEVLSANNDFIEIKTKRGIEIIPVSKVIRIEVVERNG